MRDYKDITVLETYATILTAILCVAAVFSLLYVWLVVAGGSFVGFFGGSVYAILSFALGYAGICVVRVFVGIARDIRDMRNKLCS